MGRKGGRRGGYTESQSRQKKRNGGGGRRDLKMLDSDGESDKDGLATLRIGGVTLRVDGSGNVASRRRANAAAPRRRVGLRADLPRDPYAAAFTSDDEEGEEASRQQRRKLHKQLRHGGGDRAGAASASSEGDGPMLESDAALEDYLANVDGDDGSSEEDEEGASSEPEHGGSGSGREGERGRDTGRAAAAAATPSFDMLRRFSSFDMGDEGPIGGRGWDTPGSSSSSGEGMEGSDSDEDDSGSDFSGSDEALELELAAAASGGGDGGGLLTAEDLEGLSLARRYPVQSRPAPPPPLPGQPAPSGGKRARAGVRGAKGGKLAPGEKARLRRERIEAKRAARAASRGFDLAWVDHQLREMVARQTDMLALPAMGKSEFRSVSRLAALYGCKAALQGGSGKRRVAVVSATARTALPAGEALLAVGALLATQLAAERAGAALDGRLAVAGADYSSVLPGVRRGQQQQQQQQQTVLTGNARWAGLRGSRGGKKGGGGSGEGGGGGGPQRRSSVRPVAFVSSGVMDPGADSLEVVVASAAGGSGGSGESPAELLLQQQHGAEDGPAAEQGGGAVAAMLEVVEDLGGSGSDSGSEAAAEQVAAGAAAVWEEGAGGQGSRRGLGSTAAPRYSRLSAAPLLGRPPPAAAAGGSPSLRGSLAAEGITNPGRLMGLGLALGIGSEVFGAPGCSPGGGGESPPADLSPLSPLLSKSAQRRLRRSSGGGKPPLAVSPADAAPEPGSGGGHQRHAPGKPGRSRAERRQCSGGAAAAGGEEQQEMAAAGSGGLGLGLGAAPGGNGALVTGDFADWERHSTGIGSRLMLKMGWAGSGAGLGRQQHGRAEPVEAQRRGKRVGLGAE